MSNGAKVAMAVGAGYMLGRTKKMRLALMLAAAGITGKFPTGPTQLVAHGLKALGANADVSQLTEQLRGELLNAGRAAALSAATHQIDSLNDRLQGVTSAVGVDDTLDDVGGTLDDVGGLVGGRKRRQTRSEDDDYVDEDDAYDEQDDEDDDEPLDVEEVDEDDEDVDEDLDEDEDEVADDDLDDEDEEPEPPVTRRRATRRPSTPKKSVRGTKRTAARSTARRGR
jgi:hypothetical protein